MPNHVTTLCVVTGEAEVVDAFIIAHIRSKTDDDDLPVHAFDFETIVPMPKVIKDTLRQMGFSGEATDPSVPAGSCGDGEIDLYAHAMLHGRHEYIVNRPPWLPSVVRQHHELREHYDRVKPAVGFWARRMLAAAAETGSPGWYEWSVENWGTKWDAYRYEERERAPGRFAFRFETAWSVPVPIFKKLATLYPSLTFDLESVDEGGPEYDGEFHGDIQRLVEDEHDLDRYVRVMGRKPYSDEDDQCEAAEVAP